MQLLRYIILFFCLKGMAQVGINNSNPNLSSAIDVYATNKGILVPRVNLISTNNIVLPINMPATGLLVWNTNSTVINGSGVGYYVFDGTIWRKILKKNALDAQYDQGGNGLGRIIIADAGAVRIDGTDGLIVTGTFGSGSSIDTDIVGAGTRMFFNPKKAAFRVGRVTGTNFNEANIGNYSFSSGYDNRIDGTRTFGANYNNSTSTQNNSVFGSTNQTNNNQSFSTGFTTRAGGNNALSSGSNTFSIGYNTFSNGFEARAGTINEVAIGYYSTTPAKTNSSGVEFVDSQSTFYSTDRAFVIGNGSSNLSRSNLFEIWKDGRVVINNDYSLPTNDGSSNQILSTDGSGVLSWSSTNTGISQIPLYANNNLIVHNSIILQDVLGIQAGLIPSNFISSGNVRVKLVIRYTNSVGTPSFRLRVHNGTTQTIPITTTSGWVNNTTEPGFGGIWQSDWVNWNAGSSVYQVHLSGKVANGGESISIQNCYLLIQPQ